MDNARGKATLRSVLSFGVKSEGRAEKNKARQAQQQDRTVPAGVQAQLKTNTNKLTREALASVSGFHKTFLLTIITIRITENSLNQ